MTQRARHSFLLVALVASCAVAAGTPPTSQSSEPTSAAPPVRTAPTKKSMGRKPARGAVVTQVPVKKTNAGPTGNVSVTVQVRPGPTPGPEGEPDLRFYLGQSHPNPFHTSTQIAFVAPSRGRAVLALYDVQGKKVTTLLDQVVDPGQYVVRWAGTDESGALLAPGVYMYRLEIGRHQSIRKLIFTR